MTKNFHANTRRAVPASVGGLKTIRTEAAERHMRTVNTREFVRALERAEAAQKIHLAALLAMNAPAKTVVVDLVKRPKTSEYYEYLRSEAVATFPNGEAARQQLLDEAAATL